MRTYQDIITAGVCLLIVAGLHVLWTAEPTTGYLAATGLGGLVCATLAPLASSTRRDLLLLGSGVVLAAGAHAALGIAPTTRTLTATGLAAAVAGVVGLLLLDLDAATAGGRAAAVRARGLLAGAARLAAALPRWVAPARPDDAPVEPAWARRRLGMYLAGCFLFALGVKLFIDAGMGVDPLHAMVIGIVQAVALPYVGVGLVSSAVTASFLLVWSLWNRRLPPLTTFLTMSLVGFLVDGWNMVGLERLTRLILTPTSSMLLGLLLDAYASALIIMSGIGIRVMDLVAITMVRRWGWSFVSGKMLMELGFFGVALLLAGPIGLGTVGFLVLVAPFVTPFMRANERLFHLPNFGLRADLAAARNGGRDTSAASTA